MLQQFSHKYGKDNMLTSQSSESSLWSFINVPIIFRPVLWFCKIPRVVTRKAVYCAKSNVKPSRHKAVISHHQLNGYNFGNISRRKHVKTILDKTGVWIDFDDSNHQVWCQSYKKMRFHHFWWKKSLPRRLSTIFPSNLIAAVSRLKSH